MEGSTSETKYYLEINQNGTINMSYSYDSE